MIHCYKLGGLNIVLDICSGSVHVVDEVAYDVIEMYENKCRDEITKEILNKYSDRDDVTKEELEDLYSQLEALKASGKLFTPDTFAPIAPELKKRTSGVVKALCMHIAHTCNLNCSYCLDRKSVV